jgi:dCMP deaminase
MTNLLAYIPVLNQQYFEWLKRHRDFCLYLISQEMAESFMSRLERNMVALPTEVVMDFILSIRNSRFPGSSVNIFDPNNLYPDLLDEKSKVWIMPDEDICHTIAQNFLFPAECRISVEQIWARWDMTAVKQQEPVIPDLEVSTEEASIKIIRSLRRSAQKSPDWWRQIAASAVTKSGQTVVAINKHFPTEYEVAIFGDPRINFNAGDIAGAKIYLSLHAEKGIVVTCAREGVSLEGASVYVTTFPCGDCARMLAECCIKELFFSEGYSVLKGLETLKTAGVRIVKVND